MASPRAKSAAYASGPTAVKDLPGERGKTAQRSLLQPAGSKTNGLSSLRRFAGSGQAFLAIAVIFALSGCGGASHSRHVSSVSPTPQSKTTSVTGTQGTSVAAEVDAYLFPRSGADWAIGSQLLEFEVAQVAKTTTACMKRDGLPGPPGSIYPPFQYGNAQLPNLPVIEHTFSLGVTQRLPAPSDPTQGMSKAEQAAYEAALTKCGAKPERPLAFLNSSSTNALRTEWGNITDAVIASLPVERLNQQAVRCAASTPFQGNSVITEIQKIEAAITPLNLKNKRTAARSTEEAGSRVLIRCFGPEITLTVQLLTKRRVTFFANNAEAIDQINAEADRAVSSLGHAG